MFAGLLTQVTPISYGIGAVAYLFAAVLLITSKAQHRYKMLLLSACVITGLWAAVVAAAGTLTTPPVAFVPLIVGLELLRSLAWMAVAGFVLFFAYAKRVERNLARASLAAATAAVLYIFGAALASAIGHELTPGLLRLAFTAYVLIAVLGLLMVENLFRNSGREARWAVKYLCFALGVVFIYDFFIYADAALIDRVDMRFYAARGVVSAMAAPLVIIAAARSKKWPIDLHVSRQLVFHSATLFAAGIYLLVMAMVAYSLRIFDSAWGSVAQAGFLSAAVLVLVVTLSSGKFQARLRDFISKNFFSYKYDYRREWLAFIAATSDSLTSLSMPERVMRALANMMDSTSAALWVRHQEDGAFHAVASWNMSDILTAVDLEDPFVAEMGAKPGIVHLPQRQRDGANVPELAIPDWLARHPRAWLAVPLMHAGRLLGFVLLGPARAACDLGWEDFELLKTVGSQAASYIAEADAARALAEAKRFEDFNRQFAFVIHDIKNLAGQMTLILKNAERHGDNPEFQKDMLKTISHSVTRVRTMLERLRAGVQAQLKTGPVDVSSLLRAQAQVWKLQIPALEVDVPEESVTVLADAERLDAVFNHLLQNALDAAGERGRVAIELHIEGVVRPSGRAGSSPVSDESWGVITISDNGPGMDPAFVDQKLFQPLASAKPAGFGIGAFQARQLIREMNGRLEVDTSPGKGTRMIVRLPLARTLAPVKDTGIAADAGATRGRNLQVSYG